MLKRDTRNWACNHRTWLSTPLVTVYETRPKTLRASQQTHPAIGNLAELRYVRARSNWKINTKDVTGLVCGDAL